MQSTPSPRRASLLTISLWGVPVLCSLFFATELLRAHQNSAATKPAEQPTPKETAKAQPNLAAASQTSPAAPQPALTPQQIDELLSSIQKFSDRPVWERRSTIINLDRRYKNLYVQLGLSPAKSAELRSIFIERENADSRIRIALAKTGMPVMEVLSATKEVLQRYDQKIEQCLGSEGYKIFTHRNQNSGNYSLLDGVISSLSVTEHPLPDDKKRELYATVLKTPNDEAFMTTVFQALPPEQTHVLLDAIEAQTLQGQLYQMRMAIFRQRQTAAPNE